MVATAMVAAEVDRVEGALGVGWEEVTVVAVVEAAAVGVVRGTARLVQRQELQRPSPRTT